MNDVRVAKLLRSNAPLVAIEAAAGCGKTHQGAEYARDWVTSGAIGRLLILTHTHAACDVFADRVRDAGRKVDITTIDGLIGQIAATYHSALGLPPDAARWALRQGNNGYDQLAEITAGYIERHRMIAAALARRYPTIICDEHQDCTDARHRMLMAIHESGARLRVFADPMQRIYGNRSEGAIKADLERWNALRDRGAAELLDTPHRWKTAGVGELGDWITAARQTLKGAAQIDLTKDRPLGLTVIRAANTAQSRRQFLVRDRRPLDYVKNGQSPLMVLAPTNDCGTGLRAFWNRSLQIWEGHQRPDLSTLIDALGTSAGDALAVGAAVVSFVQSTGVGFSKSGHADRLLKEITEGCARAARGPKPQAIQSLAQLICNEPDYRGAARALRAVKKLAVDKANGFAEVKIDHWSEYSEAMRLDAFSNLDAACQELARRRTHTRRKPPIKCISTIHKAKGLECDHVLLVVNTPSDLSGTSYARNRLYVGLSRGKRSLTLIVPDKAETPLIKIE